MRILILGASGLIGHKLYEILRLRFGDVYAVLHHDSQNIKGSSLFGDGNSFSNVDVLNFHQLENILDKVDPDVVLNCAGITKRRPEINEPVKAIALNSLFPHKLAEWAANANKRVVHFSTDCVFDGKTGNYTEDSQTTAADAYGRTKALGEINYDHTLTIRSSFIGRELAVFSELLEWFLSQEGKTINGFTNAYYSGVSTLEMSRIVGDIIENHPNLCGLYQLASAEPISKYDLLCAARDAFKLDIKIIPDDSFSTTPTLDGSKLRAKIGVKLPDWNEMMTAIYKDNKLY